MYEKVFLVTESERMIRSYRFLLSEDERVSLSGQMEFYYEKLITLYDVRNGEGIYRRISLVSAVREVILDAGADMHLGNDKLVKNVQRVILKAEDPRTRGENLVMIRRSNELIEQERSLKERLKLMILISLEPEMKSNLAKCLTLDNELYRSETIKTVVSKYRNLVQGTQVISDVEFGINFLRYRKMFLVTESNRMIRSYRFLLSEDE
jgi:hypothetical protein